MTCGFSAGQSDLTTYVFVCLIVVKSTVGKFGRKYKRHLTPKEVLKRYRNILLNPKANLERDKKMYGDL